MVSGDGSEYRRLPASSARGSRDRDYWVFAPRRPLWRRYFHRPSLLVVLHGCKQTGEDMIRDTRFVKEARANDYVVVFPSVTSWKPFPYRISNCWGFWIPEERHRGQGEVGDLDRILDAVELEFETEPSRRFAVGLSSGGAMAVALAVAYSDVIRAAGTIAGLAYGETSAAVSTTRSFASALPWFVEETAQHRVPSFSALQPLMREMEATGDGSEFGRPVPLFIMQSTQDRIVRIENAQLLRDVWLARGGGKAMYRERCETLDERDGERCAYLDGRGRPQVETLFYQGRSDEPTHYWPGDGDAGQFADWTGPSATVSVLNFFRRHGL